MGNVLFATETEFLCLSEQSLWAFSKSSNKSRVNWAVLYDTQVPSAGSSDPIKQVLKAIDIK